MANQESSKLPSSSSRSQLPVSHQTAGRRTDVVIDRLPTVSASQALQNLKSRGPSAISTGLKRLNQILSPHGIGGAPMDRPGGGLIRGQVTEVYGPPGVGKTAFGMQTAANALQAGDHVVWVDAAIPLVLRRLDEFLSAPSSARNPTADLSSPPSFSVDEVRSHFHHYTTPTLAHLLAMFIHPQPSSPPLNTSLIVIDSLSTLFDNSYPRNPDDRGPRNKNDAARWTAGRKFAVMNDLLSRLGKMAALHNIAILITCQTITRIRTGSRALLLPAMMGIEWENGFSTRLVLFRDWLLAQGKGTCGDIDRLQHARFVGVVKANGVTLADEGGVGTVIPFTIETSGLCDLHITAVDVAAKPLRSPARPPKRRYAEVADSEDEGTDSDELYGWAEDDEVEAEGLLINHPSLPDDLSTTDTQTDGDALPAPDGGGVTTAESTSP